MAGGAGGECNISRYFLLLSLAILPRKRRMAADCTICAFPSTDSAGTCPNLSSPETFCRKEQKCDRVQRRLIVRKRVQLRLTLRKRVQLSSPG